MAPQIAGISAEIIVEGSQDGEPFAGRVIAVAVDLPDGAPEPSAPATWFLVADDGRPAPFWVAQDDVSAQRLGR
ncbi:MAG TPA: hypothetical protein VFT50_03820 [Baekduia sp.]|nr:hypothetical protein [Baekduia sp.]